MCKILLFVFVVLFSVCLWGIKLDDVGKVVCIVWSGDVLQCQELGKVIVLVMDCMGLVDCNQIKVCDELEVMVCNEVVKMNVDMIKLLVELIDGLQLWGVYCCGSQCLFVIGMVFVSSGSSVLVMVFVVGFQFYLIKGG